MDTNIVGYINLSGPVPVVNGNGSLVEAYLYEQAIPFEGEYQRLYHFLDGDMRRMVFIMGCGYMMYGCESYKAWHWDQAGRPGPDGLWYPNLISMDRDLLSKHAGHVTSIPWESEIDEQGRLLLTVEPPWLRGETQKYRYTEGRALPDGWRLTVEQYQEHGPLAPIAAQPLPGPPLPPRPWEGLMFPGEDQDPLGIGATHEQIVTHAFPDVESEPNECIERYTLEPQHRPEEAEGLVPLTIPPNKEVKAKARVTAVQGNATSEVEVVVLRDSLNGSVTMTRTAGQDGVAHLSCEKMHRSPWPETDFAAALNSASELLGANRLFAFTHEVGFMARFLDQPPEQGLHTYRFDFIPDWVDVTRDAGRYEPYRAHYDVSGPMTLMSALAHPNVTFER